MPLFDHTGRLVDRDALRSVHIGTFPQRRPRVLIDRERDVKIVESLRDDTGTTAGHATHHSSGRIDCNVYAQAAQADTTS